MKVAYVTTYDATNVRNWSGLGYFIEKALLQQSIEIVRIGPLSEYTDTIIKAKQFYYKHVARKRYHQRRDPRILLSYAEQVSTKLRSLSSDLVFSPSTYPICYLNCHIPIVFWTDATYAGMVDFYESWTNLCRESLVNGNQMEQAALTNCRFAIYSSNWAARTAQQNYQVDQSKIKIVPFGPSFDCDRELDDIKRLVKKRCVNSCKLVFIGVDWYRKGGNLAVELAASLNRCGIKTELTIVGCTPPSSVPEFVKVKGFLSKSSNEGRLAIDELLADSHFLILPSKADCTPIAVAEANSFGVPAMTSDVGGLPDIVNNGVNGATFPLGTFVDNATAFITKVMGSSNDYSYLAESSFGEYKRRLNWEVAGKTVKQILELACH